MILGFDGGTTTELHLSIIRKKGGDEGGVVLSFASNALCLRAVFDVGEEGLRGLGEGNKEREGDKREREKDRQTCVWGVWELSESTIGRKIVQFNFLSRGEKQ